MMTTTTCKAHTRIINGKPVHIDTYSRTVGHGFTRDGRRMTRAQAEFVMILQKRARRGCLKAQARLTKQGISY